MTTDTTTGTSTTHHSNPAVVDSTRCCPCRDLCDLSRMVAALHDDSDRMMIPLLDWLAESIMECETILLCQDDLVACRKRRIHTSFGILNAIRDACRPFLGASSTTPTTRESSSSTSTPHQTKKQVEAQSNMVYENAFPALGTAVTTTIQDSSSSMAPNKLVGQKKNNSNNHLHNSNSTPPDATRNKPKRRIRPATVNPSAWAKSSLSGGNLVNVPSQDPFPMLLRDPNSSSIRPAKQEPAWAALGSTGQTRAATITPQKKKTPATLRNGNNNISSLRIETGETTTLQTPQRTTSSETPPVENKMAAPQIAPLAAVDRLIDLYGTLIDNSLVPSSALELHLLFRLLSLQPDLHTSHDSSSSSSSSPPPPLLQSILSSPDRCIYFAKESLKRQTHMLKGIGPALWEQLVQCPPFRTHMPDLAAELEAWLLSRRQQPPTWYRMSSAETTNHHHYPTTALFTLPFQPERDSRHNYKTTAEMARYQNRETSRDAFFYQLRAFLQVRGKVVDASRNIKAMEQIQQSSKTVVQGLMPDNLSWFCEFFSDLLLQIGLVPMQETDQEVLSIAANNTDKLQKLHRRFSSKTVSHNADRTSSQKVVADWPKKQNNGSHNDPKEEAQHLFPGHQEFFYLFLVSADSYAFGIHLRSHLIQRLGAISSVVTLATAEKCLMELCMLARFLGVLFFSPNWSSSPTTTTASSHVAHDASSLDGLKHLASSGLSVVDVVQAALSEHKLVLVVPWVVELLRMTEWDTVTKRSPVYQNLLSILRQIQWQLHKPGVGHEGSSMTQLVLLSIEFLFCDIIGLGQTAQLPLVPLRSNHATGEHQRVSLNLTDTAFSAGTLFACAPHVEELVTLISNLSRPDLSSMRSPGVSRKLRPSTLSPSMAPLLPNISVSLSSTGDAGETRVQDSLKAKLRDSFFHQHAELKDLCEYAVAKSLRNFSTKAYQQKTLLALQPLLSDESNANEKFVDRCREVIRRDLEANTTTVASTLAPPTVDQTTIQMSVTLVVEQSIGRIEQIVNFVVSQGAPLSRQSHSGRQPERRQLFVDERNEENSESKIERHRNLAVKSMTALTDILKSLTEDQLQTVFHSLERLLAHLDDLASFNSGSELPPEHSLRPFFLAILMLDQHSPTLLRLLLSESFSQSELRWSVLVQYVRVSVSLQQWSRHGLHNLKQYLQDPLSIDKILRFAVRAPEVEEVTELFHSLVKARILKPSNISSALDRATENGVDGVATLSAHVSRVLTK